MAITYQFLIDINRDGDYADSGEDITNHVINASWRLGFTQPYDSIAPPGYAYLTVRNDNDEYNPEVSSVTVGLTLKITADYGSGATTLWNGIIDTIHIHPGKPKIAEILAHTIDDSFNHDLITIETQQDTTTDQIIDAILNEVTTPYTALGDVLIIGISGRNTIGTHELADDKPDRSLDTGNATIEYAADRWQDGITAHQALKQIVTAERGKLYVNRSGTIKFLNRHNLFLDTTIDQTITTTLENAKIDYHFYINHITARIRPRTVGDSGTVLGSRTEPIKIRPGETRRILIPFQDDNKQPIAAIDTIQLEPGTDFNANRRGGSGTGQTNHINIKVIDTSGSSAKLDIWHYKAYPIYIIDLQIRGTPLYGNEPLTLRQYGNTTYLYPTKSIHIDLETLSSLSDAENRIQYELDLLQDPTTTIVNVELNHTTHEQQIVDNTLFDQITCQTLIPSHTDDYFLIGELHELSRTGHRCTWTLEPSTAGHNMILDTGKLDTNTLGY